LSSSPSAVRIQLGLALENSGKAPSKEDMTGWFQPLKTLGWKSSENLELPHAQQPWSRGHPEIPSKDPALEREKLE